jgi:hypothetical protein
MPTSRLKKGEKEVISKNKTDITIPIFFNMCAIRRPFNTRTICFVVIKLILFAELFLLTGCPNLQTAGPYEKDVSRNPEAWGGFGRVFTYETQEPLYLRGKSGFKSSWIAVVQLYHKPDYGLEFEILDEYPSLEQYNKNPHNWPDILGVLDAGTQVQCTKIIERGALLWEGYLYYYATIKSGNYQGMEVDINDLCLNYDCTRRLITLKPNPKILKQVPCRSLSEPNNMENGNSQTEVSGAIEKGP